MIPWTSAVCLKTSLADSHVFARHVVTCSFLLSPPECAECYRLGTQCLHVWSSNKELTTKDRETDQEVMSQACIERYEHSLRRNLCSVGRVRDTCSQMLVVSIGCAYM
jgi:hypothetical protein